MKRVWYFYEEFESEGDYEFYSSKTKAQGKYTEELKTRLNNNDDEVYVYTPEIAKSNYGRTVREYKENGYTCGILEWGYKEVN